MKIICDTREKEPFLFKGYSNVNTVTQALKTGDYSLVGEEHNITIDRKRNTGEIANNLGKTSKRFIRELDRMLKMKEAYIVCSFPVHYLQSFPRFSGIPSSKWKFLRLSNKFLMRRMYEIEESGIHVIYCEDRNRAEAKVVEILKQYGKKQKTTRNIT